MYSASASLTGYNTVVYSTTQYDKKIPKFILLKGNKFLQNVYAILLALDAILGHKSAHSFATGPVIADPFISPLLLTMTPALSSKYIKTPSFLLKGFRCRIMTAGITTKKQFKNVISIVTCLYLIIQIIYFLLIIAKEV